MGSRPSSSLMELLMLIHSPSIMATETVVLLLTPRSKSRWQKDRELQRLVARP
jgi:hypothetical protein